MESRSVHNLHLTGPNRDAVRRGVLKLEDALRTASVPAISGARQLLVRHLRLDEFAVDASPASVALRVERALRECGTSAVYALAPGAASAPAVYFRDTVEPVTELAARLASGSSPPAAWFWPLAVRGWTPSTPRQIALRLCWRAVRETRHSQSAAVAAGFVAELASRNLADPVLAVLEPADGVELLRHAGWTHTISTPAPSPAPQTTARITTPLATPELVLVARWARQWGRDDARTLWLAGALLQSRIPALAQGRSFALAVRDTITHAVIQKAPLPPQHDASFPPQNAPLPLPDAPPTMPSPAKLRHSARSTRKTQRSVAEPAPVTSVRDVLPDATWPEHAGDAGGRDAPADSLSDCAGVLFLTGLFQRLGMHSFLDEHPHWVDADFPRVLMSHLAARFARSPHDPALAALATDAPAAAGTWFVAPPQWKRLCRSGRLRLARDAPASGRRILLDPLGRLPLAQWRPSRPASAVRFTANHGIQRARRAVTEDDTGLLVRAWTEAARRWCRRQTRVSLSSVVRRPGLIVPTKTHIDVVFAHHQADVRIRRAGLDIDPGWVPWLGRQVHFHYRDPDEVEHARSR